MLFTWHLVRCNLLPLKLTPIWHISSTRFANRIFKPTYKTFLIPISTAPFPIPIFPNHRDTQIFREPSITVMRCTRNCALYLQQTMSQIHTSSHPKNAPNTANTKMHQAQEDQGLGGGGDNSLPVLDKPAEFAMKIFMQAVESVKPPTLLNSKVKLTSDNILKLDDLHGTSLDLNSFKRIFVVGFGKAALPMAEEIMNILKTSNVEKCLVNIPVGFRESNNSSIEINRGATNNIPDEEAFEGSQKIVDIAKLCGPDDLLIVLITGGGSALFPYPKPPLTLQEKSALIKELSRQGASIQELNAVRKRLSLVKGGGLITLSPCKTILSLILSDVLGDPLDVIASGPTVPSPDLDELAGQIVEKYLAPSSVPKNVQTVLSKSSTEVSTANRTVINSIIGNNSIALEAASEKARELGLLPVIVTNELSGEASKVGLEMARMACCISHKISQVTNERDSTIRKAASNMNLPKERTDSLIESLNDPKVRTDFDGICLLFGGETTVTVKGNGVGGRNQELALKAAAQIDTSANNEYVKGKVAVLSGGTDGFDGPCDAAGAVVNSDTVRSGNLKKLSPYQFLTANDSYNYFKENSDGAFHIKTGHTETNVMDLVVIVVVK